MIYRGRDERSRWGDRWVRTQEIRPYLNQKKVMPDSQAELKQRVCVQCGGLNRVEDRCVWLADAWGERQSQVCWIVLIETVTLQASGFPDVSSAFAASLDRCLPQFLKFFIPPPHLFILENPLSGKLHLEKLFLYNVGGRRSAWKESMHQKGELISPPRPVESAQFLWIKALKNRNYVQHERNFIS